MHFVSKKVESNFAPIICLLLRTFCKSIEQIALEAFRKPITGFELPKEKQLASD